MSFQTKAFAAQDGILAALRANEDLAAWTIDYGLPTRREELHIWVDEQVDSWEQGADTSGLVGRDENFRIYVYIYSRKTGADALEMRQEVAAGADIVADTIADTSTLGGSVIYAQVVAGRFEGAFDDPEGRVRQAVLQLTIGCSAYVGA